MMALRLSRALLLLVAGDGEAEFVADDLDEEFAGMAEECGRHAAEWWYVRQVLRSAIPLLDLERLKKLVETTPVAAR
jgi:hypothetical protein